MIEGRTAAERLLPRANSHKLEALLNTAHTLAPSISVFIDLASGRDMLREGESLVFPVYRVLLKRLGYSTNEVLAASMSPFAKASQPFLTVSAFAPIVVLLADIGASTEPVR